MGQSETGTESASAADEWHGVHEGSYWFPERASDFAGDVDKLFYFILWVSIFFFVAIVAVMVGFVIKYRKRPGHEQPLPSPSHNTALEILWTVLPSFLLVFMFVAGASGFFKQRIAPDNAVKIDVEASQFQWKFTYENGEQTEDLHLVVNEPVELRMYSADVLHSFFVPAFRQKRDVVPGRYANVWVKPTKPGVYRLYCAEYCGDSHAAMKKRVIVHETREDFEKAVKFDWDSNEASGETWKNGERLYSLNCKGCHSNDGKAGTGPSFLDKYGSMEELEGGGSLKVNDDYIIRSIYEPQADIVKGYGPRSQMASFKGKLNEKQIGWIIDYLKRISKNAPKKPAKPKADADKSKGDSKSNKDKSDDDKSDEKSKSIVNGP